MEQSTKEPTTKIGVIAEIIRLLEITPDVMREINTEFAAHMTDAKTVEDTVIACKDYDAAAFIAGALVSTTIYELSTAVQVQRIAEAGRLSTDNMEVM